MSENQEDKNESFQGEKYEKSCWFTSSFYTAGGTILIEKDEKSNFSDSL